MTSLAPLLIEGIQYSPLFSRCSGQTPASSSAGSGTKSKKWVFLTPHVSRVRFKDNLDIVCALLQDNSLAHFVSRGLCLLAGGYEALSYDSL